jgi:hypothetical protein
VAEGRTPEGGTVRPLTALAFATITFVALLIFGLGMTSLLLGEDVIAASGLGQAPGIVAVILATVAFVAGLWLAIRPVRSSTPEGDQTPRPAPSYWGAAWTTAGCFLGYLAGILIGAAITGGDLAAAAAAAGRIATTWFGAVIAGAALVCAWGGIALVRTRARRPRWPWEDEFDE